MSGNTLAYLATPYSGRKTEIDLAQAFWEAAEITARLLRAGMYIYSPIVHCHIVAELGEIDPRDHKFWLPICDVMMSRCDTLIVAHMDGWRESEGIAHEVEFFKRAGKPIFDLPDITTCTLVRRPDDPKEGLRRAFEAQLNVPRADHQRESWEANVGDAY